MSSDEELKKMIKDWFSAVAPNFNYAGITCGLCKVCNIDVKVLSFLINFFCHQMVFTNRMICIGAAVISLMQ
jgi:hypothetical protein